MSANRKLKTAVVQASPLLFKKDATIEKALSLIKQCAVKNAQLALFPEAFIPAYPRGLDFGTVIGSRTTEGRKLWQLYWENSISIPGPETDLLCETAKANNIYLAIGVIERGTVAGSGTLYCTLLYIGPDGKILGKHRKIKPTAAERFIWGEGDGSTLTVIETEFGRIGGLICWENYMPLARMAMYNKGVDIYLAPTADSRDTWQATLRHIACEGRCFVLGCNQYVTKQMYPEDMQPQLSGQPDIMSRGGSVIISPLGDVIEGPLFGKEDILYAELDLDEITRSKFDFDVVGHYSRPDIFQLRINETPAPAVEFDK
jgi:nitrilase